MSTDRIEKILTHSLYRECLKKLTQAEESRLYCKHDLTHFLDTARIAYIDCLENNLPLNREIIYAAALLHDIGRAYDNARHEAVSVELAAQILPECGFEPEDISLITRAIAAHRDKNTSSALGKILYTADKKSRSCFACTAKDTCNWPNDKKNKTIWR